MSAALFAVIIVTFVAVAEERWTCSSCISVEFIQIKEKCLGSPLQMKSSCFFVNIFHQQPIALLIFPTINNDCWEIKRTSLFCGLQTYDVYRPLQKLNIESMGTNLLTLKCSYIYSKYELQRELVAKLGNLVGILGRQVWWFCWITVSQQS